MLRIGCQTYTWEMLGERWTGTADDLLGSIAAGGYSGIEITDKMIGSYAARPKDFAVALNTHGLDLIAFAWASDSGFTEPAAFDADRSLYRFRNSARLIGGKAPESQRGGCTGP